jgi:hypothetical protein
MKMEGDRNKVNGMNKKEIKEGEEEIVGKKFVRNGFLCLFRVFFLNI